MWGETTTGRGLGEREIPKQQPPPSNSEELTCILLTAHYICKVGLFGIHSLTCSSLKTSLFKKKKESKKKKKNSHIQRSLWILSVRDRTTVKASMFTITQKTWWTLNKVQRSRPGVKIDPSTSRWARWLRSSESDWGERRVEVEWDPKVFISVILWKCAFSNYKWRCMCVLELNLESLEKGLFKNLKKKSRLAV